MNRILIAYFSRPGENHLAGKIVELPVGNTELAARQVQALAGGTLLRIETVRPYAQKYAACVEEVRAEFAGGVYPALARCPESLGEYDTVVLAYPNWCGTMPMAVQGFLARYDFAGKTILPLCTNEGSGMGRSEEDLKTLCPGALLRPGLPLRGGAVEQSGGEIARWLSRELPAER